MHGLIFINYSLFAQVSKVVRFSLGLPNTVPWLIGPVGLNNWPNATILFLICLKNYIKIK